MGDAGGSTEWVSHCFSLWSECSSGDCWYLRHKLLYIFIVIWKLCNTDKVGLKINKGNIGSAGHMFWHPWHVNFKKLGYYRVQRKYVTLPHEVKLISYKMYVYIGVNVCVWFMSVQFVAVVEFNCVMAWHFCVHVILNWSQQHMSIPNLSWRRYGFWLLWSNQWPQIYT